MPNRTINAQSRSNRIRGIIFLVSSKPNFEKKDEAAYGSQRRSVGRLRLLRTATGMKTLDFKVSRLPCSWRADGVVTWNTEELDKCTRQGDHFVLMIDLPKKRPPSRRCEPMNA
ncbi:hypothetical protein TTRE_0000416801 [Trichuris trichiura]|uniref:Uncharacterized protein n=1 Tax=Trichuris trichiura TaxID=36087 RepID=A0A077Z800_TRITR|nr:hypothetical protein TTRE_0000416801 [Trichuris trichiura]